MSSAPERIAERFNAHFASFNVRIQPEDVVIGRSGAIVEQQSRRWPRPSWYVSYRVDPDEDGLPCLEFHATSRMTNDRHGRISADGRGEELAAFADMFSYDSAASKKAAYEELRRRNRAIAERLKARGLYP